MAGVYTRDNINYGSMLQNAIANRIHSAERQAAYRNAMGKLWGETATNIGKYIGRGAMATADMYGDEDEAELERLLELRNKEEAIAKYNEQVEQRKAFDEVFNNPDKEFGVYNPKYNTPQGASLSEEGTRSMQGYVPLTAYTPNYHNNPYDNETDNPYIYALMQDYYRRGR